MHALDHLLWEQYRLEEGEQRLLTLSGVKPSFGGAHPELGTHNSLLSLDGGAYLELIAPDPDHPGRVDLPRETPVHFKPRLFAFVLKSHDLQLTEALIINAGLEVKHWLEVERRSPGGEVLAWQTLVVGGHDFGHFIPAFSRLERGRHPSETAPQGCKLLEFSVTHPNKSLITMYKALQVNVAVSQDDMAQMFALVSTPQGQITLTN